MSTSDAEGVGLEWHVDSHTYCRWVAPAGLWHVASLSLGHRHPYKLVATTREGHVCTLAVESLHPNMECVRVLTSPTRKGIWCMVPLLPMAGSKHASVDVAQASEHGATMYAVGCDVSGSVFLLNHTSGSFHSLERVNSADRLGCLVLDGGTVYRIVVASDSAPVLCTWQVPKGVALTNAQCSQVTPTPVAPKLSGGCKCVVAGLDGRLLYAGNSDGHVYVVDWARDFALVETLRLHSTTVRTLAMSDSGLLVSGGYDNNIVIVNTREPSHPTIANCKGHSNVVLKVTCYRDLMASGGSDHLVRLWSLRTFECLAILRGHTDNILAIHMDALSVWTGDLKGNLYRWGPINQFAEANDPLPTILGILLCRMHGCPLWGALPLDVVKYMVEFLDMPPFKDP